MSTSHAKPAVVHDTLILECTRLVTRPLPLDQKIVGILRLLSEWAKLHYGRVLLPNYAASALQVAYSYGLNRERLLAGDYSVPFDQGLTGSVWRSGRVDLVTDVTREEIFLTRIAEPIDGTKVGVGFISVPILTDGVPIGILSVQRKSDDAPPYSHDVDLLRIIASMIGSALLQMRQRDYYHVTGDGIEDDAGRLRQLCARHGIVGESPALMAAVRQIDNARNSDAPILLLGESGTGKEMFAQMIHQLSQRGSGPYIPLNCAAIPAQLLEAELFGYEKGSFTGAHRNRKGKLQQADGGTLFLDEIGDMPIDLQVKLLRVLQDRRVEPVGGDRPVEVDFRIITATHVNLKQAVEHRQFRLDLYFRLNVLPISLPPLRERRSDIPLLLRHFLTRYEAMYRRRIGLSAGVIDLMSDFPWPGNIRQLQNMVERIVLQAKDSLVTVEEAGNMLALEAGLAGPAPFPAEAVTPAPQRPQPPLPATPPDPAPAHYRPYSRVDARQRGPIMAALKATGGNQTRAAKLLGLTARQLRYRLAKLAAD